MPCFCYIVECADGSLYTGWTTNPERRVKAHNAGRGSRYTRAHRPVRLVLLEPQADRSSAMRRERAIKTLSRSRKLQLIRRSAIRKGQGKGAKPKGRRAKANLKK